MLPSALFQRIQRRMETHSSSFRAFLRSELFRRSKANPSYSLRAFARSLSLDHSTLVKVLGGQRKLGEKATRRIAQRLGLSDSEIAHFISSKSDQAGADYQQLTLDSFAAISDWYHFAILELIRSEGFKPDLVWIARVLDINADEARGAVERLQRLGLIETDAQGHWVQPQDSKSSTMGNPFTARAFKNLQRQILEKAIAALDEVPMDLRDQTSMTMAIDVSKIPEAKQKITVFRREMATFLSRGKRRDEVYHLSFSLYPVSRIKNRTTQQKENS